jgi:hypothetical protein
MHVNSLSMSNFSAYINILKNISMLAPFTGHCYRCLVLVQCLFIVSFKNHSRCMFSQLVLQGNAIALINKNLINCTSFISYLLSLFFLSSKTYFFLQYFRYILVCNHYLNMKSHLVPSSCHKNHGPKSHVFK